MFRKLWYKIFGPPIPRYVICDVCWKMMENNGHGICEKCDDMIANTTNDEWNDYLKRQPRFSGHVTSE